MISLAASLTTWTKWLAIATLAAVVVALLGLGWSICAARRERTATDKRLKDQRHADDQRSIGEIKAARDAADKQVTAAQTRLEAQRAADDERAERQIAAARKAADRQIKELQQQLDAANRPLLIEVAAHGPIYPDMGARPNPDIRSGIQRTIPETVGVRFGAATVEIDPRAIYVSFEGGFARLSLALRNVGRGLAIISISGIRLLGEDLGPIDWRTVLRERVPVGESTRVSLTVRTPQGLDIPSLRPNSQTDPWSLFVPYTDFTCRQPTFAEIRLSRETNDAPNDTWVIVAVDQVALDEFFVGETATGRVVRLYSKNVGHESLVDVTGQPFEIHGGTLLVGTVDGQLLDVQTVTVRFGLAALLVTPEGWIAAAATGGDEAQAQRALAELVDKAPAGGWQIVCSAETVTETGDHVFTLQVSNPIASADGIQITLPAVTARAWQDRSAGRPLSDLVLAEAQRVYRRWNLRKIQEQGSRTISGMPIAT